MEQLTANKSPYMQAADAGAGARGRAVLLAALVVAVVEATGA
jgi:hypothetical protein